MSIRETQIFPASKHIRKLSYWWISLLCHKKERKEKFLFHRKGSLVWRHLSEVISGFLFRKHIISSMWPMLVVSSFILSSFSSQKNCWHLLANGFLIAFSSVSEFLGEEKNQIPLRTFGQYISWVITIIWGPEKHFHARLIQNLSYRSWEVY